MLFCLSLCDETHRVILDQDCYGEVLTMIEGRDWQEARDAALAHQVMDDFDYRPGHGWERRYFYGLYRMRQEARANEQICKDRP